jgi:AcrR family transcriptional regulator
MNPAQAVAGVPVPGRRDRLRLAALSEIKAAALEQLRTEGAGGLNLRAVARAVGMSSPGLYRYFASRDDLITALIADAYDDLATQLGQARDDAGSELADRWRAVCLAYYDWADNHRAEWALIFGAPLPTYAAPVEGATTAAARRFAGVFTALLVEAWPVSGSRMDSPPVQHLGLRTGGVRTFGGVNIPDDPRFVGVAARLWSRLHGVVALGLFGHLLPSTLQPGSIRTLYEAEVEDQLTVLGLCT